MGLGQSKNVKRARSINSAILASSATLAAAVLSVVPAAQAATIWDGQANTGWWYNPINWNANANDNITLPNTGAQLNMATELNSGYDLTGDGIVFDPTNDPSFTGTGTSINPFPLATFYLGNSGTLDNKFTIKSGTLSVNTGTNGATIIARNTTGRTSTFVQQAGNFSNTVSTGSLQLANASGSTGIYEYHGGNMDIAVVPGGTTSGIRVGHANGATGKFAIYNDGPVGHIKGGNIHVAYGNSGTGATGIMEYHYSNPLTSGNFGVRPVQAVSQLSLRNGTGQSARLDLQLDETPVVDGGGVPQNLGLADYGTLNAASGFIGTDYFYNVTGATAYTNGSTVTAVYGKNYYNWTIDYKGAITWSDANTSQISSVASAGNAGTDIVLLGQSTVLGSQWSNPVSGLWSGGGNWSSAVPNGVGVIANFLTIPTGAVAVNADAPFTAGHINFENTNGYTIGGANNVTLDVASGTAAINVYSGNHAINAPLVLADNTKVTVTPGASTLTVSDLQASSVALTKAGAGTLEVNNVRTNALQVNAGTVKILTNSSATGVSTIPTLSIAASAKLDLNDNKLITNNAVGTQTGGTYNGVQGYVQTANNPGGGGFFDGPSGITTTQADATNGSGLTTIGVTTGALAQSLGPTDTAIWAGQTITGNSTMVMYTYAGDANLDGFIDGTDYFYIDSNVGTSADGYGNGDFNYDGSIDGTDYFYIDSNITGQGAPFFASGGTGELLTGVAAIPEPASLSVIGLAAASLLGRRRRH